MRSVAEVTLHPAVEPWVLSGLASVDEMISYIDQASDGLEQYEDGWIAYIDKPGFLELHLAFHPDGWGRKASAALKSSLDKKMQTGRVVVASEQEGYWRSRPPRSFGFVQTGVFEKGLHPRKLRKWILTPEAWYKSPVGRKYNEHHR